MFALAKAVMSASFKEAKAYRFHMMFSLVTGPIVVLTNYLIWKSIFASSGLKTIGGYTFEAIVTHIVIGFITFFLLWDAVNETLDQAVQSGSLVSFLLKPTDFMAYEYFWKIGHRMTAMLVEFVPVVIITGLMLGFEIFTDGHWFWYLCTVAIGTTVYFLVGMLIGMSAFWLQKAKGVKKLYNAVAWLLSGGVLPLSLYPPAVQKVFIFLPFQFLSYVPSRVFAGEYNLAGYTLNAPQTVLFGAIYAIILWLIVSVLWKVSVKKFCGVGA